MKMVKLLIFCTLMPLMWSFVVSHGRLKEPPARNTVRRGEPYNDYQDNEKNCGGFSHQWEINKGKCGLCGDPFDGPQDSMAGGKYAPFDRDIVRCYERNGRSPTVIPVGVEITAPHKGYFEFRLCVNNNMSKPINQACLDENLLKLYRTNNTRYTEVDTRKVYEIYLDVPKEIVCDQCVLQWKWNTGNSYGCIYGTDNCGLGLGPQEQFYGCADISILQSCPVTHLTPAPPTPAPQTPAPPTPAPQTPAPPTQAPVTPAPGGNTKNCKASGPHKGDIKMDDWCKLQCSFGHCPSSHCICEIESFKCEPNHNIFKDRDSEAWKSVRDWCNDSCNGQKANSYGCPSVICNDECRKRMALRELSFLIN